MKTMNSGADDYQDIDEVYEAHLFDYVLRHISKDESLEPRISNAIAMQLFEDERYADYYGKVQELYAQGLFNDSFSYADYLSTTSDHEETEIAGIQSADQLNTKASKTTAPQGKQVSMTTYLSTAAALVLALAATFLFLKDSEGTSDDAAVKMLGRESNLYAYHLGRLELGDLDIKHNSVLLKEPGDMKQCNMLLVFKGITEEGFIARSKNLGTGDEDPFLEELEVRFPDSERSSEFIEALKTSLNNRQFPEYYVQGIYVKPKQRLHSFNNLSVLLINELRSIEDVKKTLQ